MIERARRDGYEAMVFNAVVETNANAVALWRSLGFDVLATIPRAFDHPTQGKVGPGDAPHSNCRLGGSALFAACRPSSHRQLGTLDAETSRISSP